ncbi:MAG: hypothetical protein ACKPE1_11890, partial [Dolichospermum sp.]
LYSHQRFAVNIRYPYFYILSQGKYHKNSQNMVFLRLIALHHVVSYVYFLLKKGFYSYSSSQYYKVQILMIKLLWCGYPRRI